MVLVDQDIAAKARRHYRRDHQDQATALPVPFIAEIPSDRWVLVVPSGKIPRVDFLDRHLGGYLYFDPCVPPRHAANPRSNQNFEHRAGERI